MNLGTVVLSLSLLVPALARAAVPADATCTGTLAGAVAAEFACDVQATYDDKKVLIVITVQDPVAGVRSLVPLSLELASPLQLGTFTLATALDGQSRVVLAGGESFVARGARGELSLAVEAAERYSTPRRRYVIKGTLTARLAPERPGATGEVHLEVRF